MRKKRAQDTSINAIWQKNVKTCVLFLHKYNEKLSEVGQKYGFKGKICFETRITQFENLYRELVDGVKNCEQVSNEIY